MKVYNYNVTFNSMKTDKFERVDECRGLYVDSYEIAKTQAEVFLSQNNKDMSSRCCVYAASYEVIEIDAPEKVVYEGVLEQISDWEDWDVKIGSTSLQSELNYSKTACLNGKKVRLTIEVIE